ncbi:MAG: hypothetical protein HYZ37_09615 [Candidatus Solibacter usitatus]|nr:hypothetical protein [Candidatus Solibacter usitatus]
MRIRTTLLTFSAIAALTVAAITAAEVHPVRRGKLILEDDFNGMKLDAAWKIAKGKWSVTGGRVQGVELADDKHNAVARRDLKFHDAVIETSFRLEKGAKMLAISLNGAGGHVCRVTIRPDAIIVQKDKMNAKATEPAAILAKKNMKFDTDQWYKLTMEVRGKSLTARINDGEPIGGEHAGVDLDKTNIGLPVGGDGAWFDYLRVWEVAR